MPDQNIPEENEGQTCSCITDPFASLPPELQPKNKSWKMSFRQITCPGCEMEYWTNCEGELCSTCQKKRPS